VVMPRWEAQEVRRRRPQLTPGQTTQRFHIVAQEER